MDLMQKKQNDQLVTDGSESTFMDDVVEASKNQPVIVDFWAPWCGPCKSLGPALEAEINSHSGKVKMVKIDIDQNQSIAQQMRIQSIPAVFAFVDGQPVDGFQGAKTPSDRFSAPVSMAARAISRSSSLSVRRPTIMPTASRADTIFWRKARATASI